MTIGASEKKWAGIDGCKGGWILCEVSQSAVQLSFLKHLNELCADCYEAVLIDIPLACAVNGHRSSEVAGKKILKQRSSSLFFTPVKEAIEEKEYCKSLEINRRRIGKGFSKQMFYLFPKIIEAIAWKAKYPFHIFESHPELCFLGWMGFPPKFSKKSKEGLEERLRLIERLDLCALSGYQRNPFSNCQDDVIDAIILALTARQKASFTYLGDKEEAFVYYINPAA